MTCPGEFSVSLELSLSLSDRTESAGQTGFPMGFKKFLSFLHNPSAGCRQVFI
jgi:hypothetical protein